MNNDAALLSLLSSQRELLDQLNLESTYKQEKGKNPMLIGKGDMFFQPEPFAANNTSISERRGSLDSILLSKQFSTGIGSENLILPDTVTKRFHNPDETFFSKHFSLGMGAQDFFQNSRNATTNANKTVQDPIPGRHCRKVRREKFESELEQQLLGKKRRLSSIEFLSPNFFDEVRHFRRLSMASQAITSKLSAAGKVKTKDTSAKPGRARRPKLNAHEIKSTMKAFSTAMERSQKTQQDIHDWDKKMGLKRSHSKTMRLSARSRKLLRSMLKKQINALSSQTHSKMKFSS